MLFVFQYPLSFLNFIAANVQLYFSFTKLFSIQQVKWLKNSNAPRNQFAVRHTLKLRI
jgi:hypothetical protein